MFGQYMGIFRHNPIFRSMARVTVVYIGIYYVLLVIQTYFAFKAKSKGVKSYQPKKNDYELETGGVREINSFESSTPEENRLKLVIELTLRRHAEIFPNFFPVFYLHNVLVGDTTIVGWLYLLTVVAYPLVALFAKGITRDGQSNSVMHFVTVPSHLIMIYLLLGTFGSTLM